MVQIYCKNLKQTKNFSKGCTLFEIYRAFDLDLPFGPTNAKVNNRVVGLDHELYHSADVEFLDLHAPSGQRTYVRSLFFVMTRAVAELFPEGEVWMQHPVSNGYYCSLRLGREVELKDIQQIKKRMGELVAEGLPFEKVECRTDEAMTLFAAQRRDDVVELLRSNGKLYTTYYKLGECIDYFYGTLVPDTSYLKLFDVVKYYDGLLLRVPTRVKPDKLGEMVKQERMLGVFKEQLTLQETLSLSTVGELNKMVAEGRANELIHVSEALQEKKIARIADEIAQRGAKVILISGPSSSGKTTFSKRLSVQLMTCGLRPYPVSLDDYFVERDQTPRDETGDYDYESLYALDLELFNRHLTALLAGEEVDLPRYDFTSGHKTYTGNKVKLDADMVLILEGIHALNPALTPNIPAAEKFKVYVSALTTVHLDHHNYIPTTDNRLLRRIIRDYNYRGCSAEATIQRWPSVRAGEDKWIFPYQENADAMFNSALIFELAVIKDHVEPVLSSVPEGSPAYAEAYRLRKFINYFKSIPNKDLPPTSLLREFLGGSSFKY